MRKRYMPNPVNYQKTQVTRKSKTGRPVSLPVLRWKFYPSAWYPLIPLRKTKAELKLEKQTP